MEIEEKERDTRRRERNVRREEPHRRCLLVVAASTPFRRCRRSRRGDDVPRACHRTLPPTRSLHMDRYRPSYNVSPGFNLPVVRREDACDSDGYVLHCMKWGLIPSFSKNTEKPDHYKMFNARSESLNGKASFRRLVPKNRCLVAVEGDAALCCCCPCSGFVAVAEFCAIGTIENWGNAALGAS